ncbi:MULTISPECIES: NUDIX domain-containing protein [Exiguobacterium]|uniref:NUDIX domain-containing protein n=1 Tax=Exiguobacterium TaxID=33986 RepID=UPI001BE8E0C1|nr:MULTISPECIES: NUDIX hydrolase [Exiguobacterium]MCT4776447.1 NUDIX hydrolase [Exiguobacterium aquaticum]MCT4788687.1 NUDIX hydrolase [Exiguobacterium mexicanum]
MEEKTIEREVIYEGKIFNVEKHVVSLPNGGTSVRELVYHNGAVAVLVVDEDDRIVLVEQYRKAFESLSLEIPAGKLEVGEEPIASAKRELEEETGYTAESLEKIFSFYGAPGFCSERVDVYVAHGLTAGTMNLDEDEFLQVQRFTFDEAIKLLASGHITDAKTIMAIQWWQLSKLK